MTQTAKYSVFRRLPEVSRKELRDFLRAERGRISSLQVYITLWVGLYAYAIGAAIWAANAQSAGTASASLMNGVDRFLPLQLIAAMVALALILCGRSIKHAPKVRRASYMPAALTIFGSVITVGAVLATQDATFTYAPAQQIAPPADLWIIENASAEGVVSL